MSEAPQEVQLPLSEFDRTQLPVEQRELSGDDFREAVREHLSAQFADQGGAAQIVVTEDRIIMRWTDNTEPKPLSHVGIDLSAEYQAALELRRKKQEQWTHESIIFQIRP